MTPIVTTGVIFGGVLVWYHPMTTRPFWIIFVSAMALVAAVELSA